MSQFLELTPPGGYRSRRDLVRASSGVVHPIYGRIGYEDLVAARQGRSWRNPDEGLRRGERGREHLDSVEGQAQFFLERMRRGLLLDEEVVEPGQDEVVLRLLAALGDPVAHALGYASPVKQRKPVPLSFKLYHGASTRYLDGLVRFHPQVASFLLIAAFKGAAAADPESAHLNRRSLRLFIASATNNTKSWAPSEGRSDVLLRRYESLQQGDELLRSLAVSFGRAITALHDPYLPMESTQSLFRSALSQLKIHVNYRSVVTQSYLHETRRRLEETRHRLNRSTLIALRQLLGLPPLPTAASNPPPSYVRIVTDLYENRSPAWRVAMSRAFVGEEVVGKVSARADHDVWFVSSSNVAPAYRRQGIATALYQALGRYVCELDGKPLVSSYHRRSPMATAVWRQMPRVRRLGPVTFELPCD